MNSIKRLMVLLCLIFISTYQINSLVVKVSEEQFMGILKDDSVVVFVAGPPAPIGFSFSSSQPTHAKPTTPGFTYITEKGGFYFYTTTNNLLKHPLTIAAKSIHPDSNISIETSK